MWLAAFGRLPSAEELRECQVFVTGREGDAAAWVDLAHALFNVKEFIYVR